MYVSVLAEPVYLTQQVPDIINYGDFEGQGNLARVSKEHCSWLVTAQVHPYSLQEIRVKDSL